MKTKLSRVEATLEKRRRAVRGGKGAMWVSVLAHGLGIAAILVAPLLGKEKKRPPEFVSVSIVPAQALGVRNPPPAPASRPEPAKPAPEPKVEPKKEQPKPKVPEPTQAKTPKPTPRETRPQAPSNTTESSPAPAPTQQIQRREGSPTGSSTGTATFGGRVGFDNPNFRHSYYVDRMTAMLSSQWTRSPAESQLVTLVHFVIGKSGSVSDTRIVETSGSSGFDLAAMRAVQQAAPFPPLPQAFSDDQLGVTVEFR